MGIGWVLVDICCIWKLVWQWVLAGYWLISGVFGKGVLVGLGHWYWLGICRYLVYLEKGIGGIRQWVLVGYLLICNAFRKMVGIGNLYWWGIG